VQSSVSFLNGSEQSLAPEHIVVHLRQKTAHFQVPAKTVTAAENEHNI